VYIQNLNLTDFIFMCMSRVRFCNASNYLALAAVSKLRVNVETEHNSELSERNAWEEIPD